ncbi:MAG: YbaK/EbsC family protein [Phycisphaerae bacterium]|nr:YbaK/EbsC family protein [Phycisphaerae bacterium]
MHIQDYLENEHIHFVLRSHKPSYDSQRLAATEHISGMDVAKPVIINADGKFYMCVLPACCKVDVETLREQIQADSLRLASEYELAHLFPNCQLGAEPPFGNLYNMPTLMDNTLAPDDYIVFQADRHDMAIEMHMRDYYKIVKPKILSFSYHLH